MRFKKIRLFKMSDSSESSVSAEESQSSSDEETTPDTVFIEQYVQDVIDFSSQYGSDISISYTAYNIIGKPSKFPDYGDFPQAFVMRTYGQWWDQSPSRTDEFMPQNQSSIIAQDFIEVLFEQKVFPCCLSVYETYNPGALIRVWAEQRGESWVLLWEGQPQVVGHTPRIFTPPIQSTRYPTNIIRLEFNQSHLDYYTELDAVLLVGMHSPQQGYLHYKKGLENSQIGNGQLTSKVKELCFHENVVCSSDEIREFLMLVNAWEQTIKEEKYKLTQITRNLGNLSCLPDETILKVLGYLDLQSLCRCAQVSVHMHRLATDPLLYTSLGLQPYWHCMNRTALETFVDRCQYLQQLDLSWCGTFGKIQTSDFNRFIRLSGSHLTNIRLNCCKFVDNSSIIELSRVCRNLKELGLRNSLSVRESGFLSLASLIHLERLDLYRTTIENAPLQAILKANTSMKHLNLGSCGLLASLDDIAAQLAHSCLGLISLDLWKGYSLTPAGLRSLSKLSHLQELDLSWCAGVGAPGDSLQVLANGCQDLRKLYLVALRGVSDRDLAQVAACCTHLQQLDLLGVRNITGDICFTFLTMCNELKMLDVSFCDQILDSQVASWREAFPLVSIKRSFQSSGCMADSR